MFDRKTLFAAIALGGAVALGGVLAAGASVACTRALWSDNGLAIFVGRTMDWPESTQPILTVLPRGMKRDGGRAGAAEVVTDNPLRWTSQYGSLVTTIYGIGTADGLNEKGLGAHMLYLDATDFGPRDASKPGLQAGLWAQYILDNAATVSEALALLEKVQIVMVEAHGHKAFVHLAMADASGDSAIVEYIGGKPVIHHGRQYRIMTNDPPYDQQLAAMKAHDFSSPSSTMPLPGNVNPLDRFARASYYSALLPKPKSLREAAASMFAIARNVSVPFGADRHGGEAALRHPRRRQDRRRGRRRQHHRVRANPDREPSGSQQKRAGGSPSGKRGRSSALFQSGGFDGVARTRFARNAPQ